MNVVDSSGWVEYFCDGANASAFEGPLSKPEKLVVPSITILEVCKFLFREAGEEAVENAASEMVNGLVVTLDEHIAVLAAQLGHAHKLPLADSVILATARLYNATLWTQDQDFEGLPGVRYLSKH